MFNQPVLAAILSAAVAGTGGFANAQAVALQTFTGATPRAFSIHIGRDDEEGILNTQEKLAGIRRYLSLNATELAKVLNVGRPTVYSWATAPVAMHSKHRERIEAIYQLGRQWRALSSDPMGNSVREPLSNGRTMVDLLSADKLDSVGITKAMLQVRDRDSRAQKRLSVTEIARRSGMQPPSRPRRNWRSSGDLDVEI